MNRTEFALFVILIGVIVFCIVVIAGNKYVPRDECFNITPLNPEKDVKLENIDMAYDVTTNQTYWKYPNETLWRLLK